MTDTIKDLYTQLQAFAPQIGVQHSVNTETSHMFKAFAKSHTTIAEAEGDTYEDALRALLIKLQSTTVAPVESAAAVIIDESPVETTTIPVVTANAAIAATHSFGASPIVPSASPDPAEALDIPSSSQAAQ